MRPLSKTVACLMVGLLLTSCSEKTSQSKTNSIERNIPKNCESTKMLDAFLPDVKNPRVIPTKWQPAPGTDLELALNIGGIACSYGVAEAGIGTTVYWTKNQSNIFDERVKIWQAKGFSKFDIPNLEEKAAYLSLNSSEVAEIHSASVNLLIDELWIQINCSWAYAESDFLPLIDKAIASTISL